MTAFQCSSLNVMDVVSNKINLYVDLVSTEFILCLFSMTIISME